MITVLICSHLAPPSLMDTLRSVATQEGLQPGDLEVILVNNGFPKDRERDCRAVLAAHGLELRIVFEPRPGLGFARRAGFLAARGGYLLLLDDDNTIARDAISALQAVLGRLGRVGAVTPVVQPAWAGPPPPAWVRAIGPGCLSYNVEEHLPNWLVDRRWDEAVCPRPPGGGMIIHREAATQYALHATDDRLLLGRGPTNLHGSEDEDIWREAVCLGYGVASTRRVRVLHHIPPARTQLSYLRKLNFQTGFSHGRLAAIGEHRAPARALLHAAGKLALAGVRHLPSFSATQVRVARELGFFLGLIIEQWSQRAHVMRGAAARRQ